MNALLEKLGIDWSLFLSQALNFFLLLVVLRLFVYKPLLKVLHQRRRAIEEGLAKAKEAEVRLREVDEIFKVKVRQAEHQSIEIMKTAEQKARSLEMELVAEAQKKQQEIIQRAEQLALMQKKEAIEAARKEAIDLVKQALVKTVELKPEEIDTNLIAKVVRQVKL